MQQGSQPTLYYTDGEMMARGATKEVGSERVSPNGYTYIKQPDGSWKLKHWIIAETERGGTPIDTNTERVRFKDGKRDNLDPRNIEIVPKGRSSLRRRKAQIEARIQELSAELAHINRELNL
jgi:hypothetical protein